MDSKEPTVAVVTVLPVPSPTTPSSPRSHVLDADSESEKEGEFSPLALDEDLTPLPAYKAAGTTETDFGGLLSADRPLRLREDLRDGCGGQLWPAGMTLARYMLRYHSGSLKGKRILELGAGGGLVGLAVAGGCDLGEARAPLYITDQKEMYSLMRHNIALNSLEGKVEAMVLNWGEPLPAEIAASPPDVILAADCVYFEPAFPLLLTTLTELLALCPDAVVYFCFMKRRRADMQFLKQARRRFCVAEVEDEERPIWSRQGLFLFAITAKESGHKEEGKATVVVAEN
ncbi:putative methyltransferase-domain-containing protein [Xylariaceae sp. FL1651]|nr:putative methyltransferase-domain-containing protein [Xylariaceae sp. FL1651]